LPPGKRLVRVRKGGWAPGTGLALPGHVPSGRPRGGGHAPFRAGPGARPPDLPPIDDTPLLERNSPVSRC